MEPDQDRWFKMGWRYPLGPAQTTSKPVFPKPKVSKYLPQERIFCKSRGATLGAPRAGEASSALHDRLNLIVG